jgi:nucleoside-diphosphate-sugar epimerase
VGEIIEIIQQVTQQRKKIICDEEVRINEMSDVVADISKARECLGWTPKHTLADGIKRIVEQEKERA